MNFKNIDRRKSIIFLFIIVVVVVIICFAVGTKRNSDKIDVSKGVNYIKQLESADFSGTEAQIKQIKVDAFRQSFADGTADVWSFFSDMAIMGDSRAVGFQVFGFLDENHVSAAGGATIRRIPEMLDQITPLNPSAVFLSYGINDLSIGFWNNPEEYIAELDEMIAYIKEKLPDTDVYVCSIIPAQEKAFQKASVWREIPDWNVEIKAHCEEKNIPYVDLSETIKEHEDLYDPDAIHMQKEFYDYWAIDLVTEVFEHDEQSE